MIDQICILLGFGAPSLPVRLLLMPIFGGLMSMSFAVPLGIVLYYLNVRAARINAPDDEVDWPKDG